MNVILLEYIGDRTRAMSCQRTAGVGGGDRIRTRDPQLAKLVLYQLSYAPYHSSYVMEAEGIAQRS